MFGMAAKFVRLHDGLAWLLLDFDELARPLAWPMQSPQISFPSLFYMRMISKELRRRLVGKRRLYRDESPFSVLDTPWARFVAPWLGTNPWKVMVPTALLLTLVLRLIFGREFSE